MAAFRGPGCIEKRQLEDTPMYVSHLHGGKEQSFTAYEWTVNGFSQLKRNITYKNRICENGFEYTIVKTKHALVFTLSTTLCYKMPKCYICYVRHHIYRECSQVTEIKGGVYKFCIPLDYVLAPQNTYVLEKDMVVVQLRLDFKRQRNIAVRPISGQVNDVCLQSLSTDLLRETPHLKNFKMFKNNNKIFATHKALLAARSRAFRDYFAGAGINVRNKFPTSDMAINAALCFLLSGSFEVSDDMLFMIDLLYESLNLRILSLESLCTIVLKDEIYLGNACEIRQAGKKTGILSLKEAVDEFLADRGFKFVSDSEE